MDREIADIVEALEKYERSCSYSVKSLIEETKDYQRQIESLQMDLETFSANSMKAMEIKDKEILRLTKEIEQLKLCIQGQK